MKLYVYTYTYGGDGRKPKRDTFETPSAERPDICKIAFRIEGIAGRRVRTVRLLTIKDAPAPVGPVVEAMPDKLRA